MKRYNYIFAILIALFLFACEKESFDVRHPEKEHDKGLNVNPTDTAGVVIPEGYAMVIMGENQAETKSVTGSSNRISHLQYLIYESTGGGYLLYKKEIVFESFGSKNWPYNAQIEILPKGKDWKVVFLGNMSKSIFGSHQTEEVLTGVEVGTSMFDNVHIHLPQVEFTNQTMFHCGISAFNTKDEGTTTVEVPVTLQRIVSRHDIYQEGPASMDEYYTQVLKDKLYADIFTASNSIFRYQLREHMLKNVIWPITYMGLQAVDNPNDYKESYKAVKWYLDNPGMYIQAYLDAWKKMFTTVQNTFGFLKQNDYQNNYYLNLAEYLYNVFVEDNDPAIIEHVLTQICNENYNDFITNAQNKIGTYFKANYKSGILFPWTGNAIIDRGSVPSVIDLTFNVIEKDIAGLKCYNSISRTNGRSYYSVTTLPDADEKNKLVFNTISLTDRTNDGGGIEQLPESDKRTEISSTQLDGGAFLQNMKYDCILKLTAATLKDKTSWTPYDNNWQDVDLSYYNILENLSLTDDTKGTITIGSGSFKKILCTNQSYGSGAYYAGAVGELQMPLGKVLNSIHNITTEDIGDPKVVKALRVPFSLKAPIFQDNIEAATAWNEAISNPEP